MSSKEDIKPGDAFLATTNFTIAKARQLCHPTRLDDTTIEQVCAGDTLFVISVEHDNCRTSDVFTFERVTLLTSSGLFVQEHWIWNLQCFDRYISGSLEKIV